MKEFFKFALVVAATVLVTLFVNSVNSMDSPKSEHEFVTRLDRVTVSIEGDDGKLSFQNISEHRNEKTKSVSWVSSFNLNEKKYFIAFECIDFSRGEKYRPTFMFIKDVSDGRMYEELDSLPIGRVYVEKYVMRMCGVSKNIYLGM